MSKNKFKVYWSDIAKSDLEMIIEYIAKENENIAYEIYTQIKSSSLELENFPNRGRIVPELEYFFIRNYREIIIKVWRVIYRIDGDQVFILAVLDSRRNIEDLLLNRLLK